MIRGGPILTQIFITTMCMLLTAYGKLVYKELGDCTMHRGVKLRSSAVPQICYHDENCVKVCLWSEVEDWMEDKVKEATHNCPLEKRSLEKQDSDQYLLKNSTWEASEEANHTSYSVVSTCMVPKHGCIISDVKTSMRSLQLTLEPAEGSFIVVTHQIDGVAQERYISKRRKLISIAKLQDEGVTRAQIVCNGEHINIEKRVEFSHVVHEICLEKQWPKLCEYSRLHSKQFVSQIAVLVAHFFIWVWGVFLLTILLFPVAILGWGISSVFSKLGICTCSQCGGFTVNPWHTCSLYDCGICSQCFVSSQEFQDHMLCHAKVTDPRLISEIAELLMSGSLRDAIRGRTSLESDSVPEQKADIRRLFKLLHWDNPSVETPNERYRCAVQLRQKARDCSSSWVTTLATFCSSVGRTSYNTLKILGLLSGRVVMMHFTLSALILLFLVTSTHAVKISSNTPSSHCIAGTHVINNVGGYTAYSTASILENTIVAQEGDVVDRFQFRGVRIGRVEWSHDDCTSLSTYSGGNLCAKLQAETSLSFSGSVGFCFTLDQTQFEICKAYAESVYSGIRPDSRACDNEFYSVLLRLGSDIPQNKKVKAIPYVLYGDKLIQPTAPPRIEVDEPEISFLNSNSDSYSFSYLAPPIQITRPQLTFEPTNVSTSNISDYVFSNINAVQWGNAHTNIRARSANLHAPKMTNSNANLIKSWFYPLLTLLSLRLNSVSHLTSYFLFFTLIIVKGSFGALVEEFDPSVAFTSEPSYHSAELSTIHLDQGQAVVTEFETIEGASHAYILRSGKQRTSLILTVEESYQDLELKSSYITGDYKWKLSTAGMCRDPTKGIVGQTTSSKEDWLNNCTKTIIEGEEPSNNIFSDSSKTTDVNILNDYGHGRKMVMGTGCNTRCGVDHKDEHWRCTQALCSISCDEKRLVHVSEVLGVKKTIRLCLTIGGKLTCKSLTKDDPELPPSVLFETYSALDDVVDYEKVSFSPLTHSVSSVDICSLGESCGGVGSLVQADNQSIRCLDLPMMSSFCGAGQGYVDAVTFKADDSVFRLNNENPIHHIEILDSEEESFLCGTGEDSVTFGYPTKIRLHDYSFGNVKITLNFTSDEIFTDPKSHKSKISRASMSACSGITGQGGFTCKLEILGTTGPADIECDDPVVLLTKHLFIHSDNEVNTVFLSARSADLSFTPACKVNSFKIRTGQVNLKSESEILKNVDYISTGISHRDESGLLKGLFSFDWDAKSLWEKVSQILLIVCLIVAAFFIAWFSLNFLSKALMLSRSKNAMIRDYVSSDVNKDRSVQDLVFDDEVNLKELAKLKPRRTKRRTTADTS